MKGPIYKSIDINKLWVWNKRQSTFQNFLFIDTALFYVQFNIVCWSFCYRLVKSKNSVGALNTLQAIESNYLRRIYLFPNILMSFTLIFAYFDTG